MPRFPFSIFHIPSWSICRPAPTTPSSPQQPSPNLNRTDIRARLADLHIHINQELNSIMNDNEQPFSTLSSATTSTTNLAYERDLRHRIQDLDNTNATLREKNNELGVRCQLLERKAYDLENEVTRLKAVERRLEKSNAMFVRTRLREDGYFEDPVGWALRGCEDEN